VLADMEGLCRISCSARQEGVLAEMQGLCWIWGSGRQRRVLGGKGSGPAPERAWPWSREMKKALTAPDLPVTLTEILLLFGCGFCQQRG